MPPVGCLSSSRQPNSCSAWSSEFLRMHGRAALLLGGWGGVGQPVRRHVAAAGLAHPAAGGQLVGGLWAALGLHPGPLPPQHAPAGMSPGAAALGRAGHLHSLTACQWAELVWAGQPEQAWMQVTVAGQAGLSLFRRRRVACRAPCCPSAMLVDGQKMAQIASSNLQQAACSWADGTRAVQGSLEHIGQMCMISECRLGEQTRLLTASSAQPAPGSIPVVNASLLQGLPRKFRSQSACRHKGHLEARGSGVTGCIRLPTDTGLILHGNHLSAQRLQSALMPSMSPEPSEDT